MDTCKTHATSRRLDEALEEGFPASDPPALTEPAGDARDVSGCCCSTPAEAPAAQKPKGSGCCGSAKA